MTWNITQRRREILAAEKGMQVHEAGGRIKVALLWPGDYRTAMSALGYMSIYSMLNSRPDTVAERFFLPDGTLAAAYEKDSGNILSLENGLPLSDFEIIAASLSLENDYWIFPYLLKRGGLHHRRAERSSGDPLVLAGGVAVWANPWPVMDFCDLILTGEAETQWPALISAWHDVRLSSLPKTDRIDVLSRKTPGALNPGALTESPSTPEGGFRDFFAPQVKPAALAWPPPEEMLPPVSPILTPEAEFSNTKLVEISRGCPYGCRFCLAGFIFRPHRAWPLEKIISALGEPEQSGEKVGLISPAAADHPQLPELLEYLLKQQRKVTLSSLRLTAVNEQLAALLAAGRLQGAAVAPEGGSQRLRNIINKDLSEQQILNGVRLLSEAGLSRIKLYFIVGLPHETDEDLEELVDLCRKIRAVAKDGKARPYLTLSLANFTPKAHTPFENAAMHTEAEFKRKGIFLANALKSETRFTVNVDPPLWSILQGILARGGPESSALVEAMMLYNGKIKASLKAINYGPAHFVHQPWPADKPKPWNIIKPVSGEDYIQKEAVKALQALTTPSCPAQNLCGRCRACD